MQGLFAGHERTRLAVGNRRLLAPDKLRANSRAIQARNDIEVADLVAAPESWELFRPFNAKEDPDPEKFYY